MANNLKLALPASNIGKKDKEKAYQYVCALLNSNGGSLTLETRANHDSIIRPIEQSITNMIGAVHTSRHLRKTVTSEGYILKVKGYNKLCTLNYNLYVPSDTQKMPVGAIEVKQVKELLNENRIIDITDIEESPELSFIYDQPIGTHESNTVQFKYVQSEKDLALALLHNNDLTKYVSAFANYCGGVIYCGVDDKGIVKGQNFQDDTDSREAFYTKIRDSINKMVWPEYIDEPKMGPDGQFDILFQPVSLSDGTPITPPRFVVVVKVPECRGGVFCDRPESYHVVDGAVRKMEFAEWKRRMLYSNKIGQLEPVSNLPMCTWDRVVTRNQCDGLDGRMLRLINNGRWDRFTRKADEMGKDPDEQLVLLSKWCMFYYRKNMFTDALRYLDQLKDQLPRSKNVLIFNVRERLVRSALERSRGNHAESYRIAEELLSEVEQLAPSILTAEFYVHFATMLTIFEGNDDLKKEIGRNAGPGTFRNQAIDFYHKSLQHLETTSYVAASTVDMQLKSYINLAILQLGCSLSGDVVNEKVSEQDIKEANTCLKRAVNLKIDSGETMTGFRSCHFHFAEAFSSYRKAQHERSDTERKIDLLEDAIAQAQVAKMRAEKNDFKELSAYADAHTKLFEKELKSTEANK